MTVEGIVLGQTIVPVNLVTDEGLKSTDFDLSVGPLSITSDGATSHCDSGPGSETCESSLNNLLFKLYGLNVITADSLHSQSNTSGGTSNSNGTVYSNVCILQSADNPCTFVTATQNNYDINIPGVVQGTITIPMQDATTAEGGVAGSGLTVTMFRIVLTTPAGAIDVDLVKVHTFVAGTVQLPPPAAPTVAQLPQTGGPPGDSNSAINGWYIALAGLVIFLGTAVAITFPRARREPRRNDF